MLIAALFPITKVWEQPMRPLIDYWIKIIKQERNLATCDNMDGLLEGIG